MEPVVSAYVCRQRVIEAIVNQHADFDPRVVGSVVVLGMGHPQSQTNERTPSVDNSPDATNKSKSDLDMSVDGKAIFAEALAHCFINETVVPKPASWWHDPNQRPLSNQDHLNSLLAKIDEADCVVLLNDDSQYDLDLIHEHNANIVGRARSSLSSRRQSNSQHS